MTMLKMLTLPAVALGVAAGLVGYATIPSQQGFDDVVAEVVDRVGTNESTNQSSHYDVLTMDVRNPLLSPTAWQGRALYKKWCSSCHGKTTGGTASGPPLVMYSAEHHGDDSFFRAVQDGVKQHHWNFGDMPPIPGLTREQVRKIILYVRETQIADERRYGELDD